MSGLDADLPLILLQEQEMPVAASAAASCLPAVGDVPHNNPNFGHAFKERPRAPLPLDGDLSSPRRF